MTHWLIFYDDLSNGWNLIDLVCYKDQEEAMKFFHTLKNTENKIFHLTEVNDIRTNKKVA